MEVKRRDEAVTRSVAASGVRAQPSSTLRDPRPDTQREHDSPDCILLCHFFLSPRADGQYRHHTLCIDLAGYTRASRLVASENHWECMLVDRSRRGSPAR